MAQGCHLQLIAVMVEGASAPFFFGACHAGMVCAMGRNSCFGNSRVRLAWGLLLGFLVVGVAYAATYDVTPTSVTYSSRTAAGVNTRSAFESTFNGATRHHTAMVPVSTGTLGGLAKAFAKRAVPAYMGYSAFKSLLDGAGWAIDELSQQVVVPGAAAEPLTGEWNWCANFKGHDRCGTPAGLCSAMASLGHLQCVNSFVREPFLRFQTQNDIDAGGGDPQRYSSAVATRTYTADWSPFTPVGGTDAVPVSDLALGELVAQSPQVINAILIDPETGAPIRTTELVAAMNALRQSLEAANSAATPGTDVVAGDLANPQPMESAWPQFCSWATPVCDFIDWVKTEPAEVPKKEVPWEVDPPNPTVEWSSGLGAGSCPSPYSFTVSLGGYSTSPEFSVQPVCDFAVIMRPVIIAISLLMAGYILAGLRGAKDA